MVMSVGTTTTNAVIGNFDGTLGEMENVMHATYKAGVCGVELLYQLHKAVFSFSC